MLVLILFYTTGQWKRKFAIQCSCLWPQPWYNWPVINIVGEYDVRQKCLWIPAQLHSRILPIREFQPQGRCTLPYTPKQMRTLLPRETAYPHPLASFFSFFDQLDPPITHPEHHSVLLWQQTGSCRGIRTAGATSGFVRHGVLGAQPRAWHTTGSRRYLWKKWVDRCWLLTLQVPKWNSKVGIWAEANLDLSKPLPWTSFVFVLSFHTYFTYWSSKFH